jgi:hypothetical protein
MNREFESKSPLNPNSTFASPTMPSTTTKEDKAAEMARRKEERKQVRRLRRIFDLNLD